MEVLPSLDAFAACDPQKLTLEAARTVRALLDAGKGLEVVKEVVTVSTQGRAPKQSPGIFTLAVACRCAVHVDPAASRVPTPCCISAPSALAHV